MIIQTDYSAILNIFKQSFITSTISTIRLNLQLVRASQFLQQFKLDVCHKLGKEYIILDTLSHLASINVGPAKSSYSELDTLFTYITTIVKIHSTFVSGNLAGYKVNPYWSRL